MSGFDDYLNAAPADHSSFAEYVGDATPTAAPTAAPSTPAAAAPSAVQTSPLYAPLAGFARGMGNAATGIEQLAGKGASALGADTVGNWLQKDAAATHAGIESDYAPTAAAHPYLAGAGNLAGSVTAALPLTVGTGGVGGAAASGALAAAEQPVDPSANFWPTKLGQAAAGGALGGAGGVVANAVLPRIMPAAQRLLGQGVALTPAQMGGGALNNVEQKLTSAPFVGEVIRNARQGGVNDWNLAMYRNALEPIGGTLPADTEAGGAGVQAVRQQVGKAFDDVANNATFNYDYGLHSDLASIRNQLDQMVPQDVMNEYDRVVGSQIMNKMDPNSGMMSGEQWNTSRSNLNTRVRNIRTGQPNADQTELANALDQVNDAMTQNVVRSSPPNVGPDLQNASLAYARYKQIERAAGYRGASNAGNVFTPAQFNGAVAAGSTAAQKATNTGLSAGLGQDAQSVLGNTVPDSGTAGRGAMLEGLIALPHMLRHPFLGAGAALAPVAYNPTVQAAYRALLQSPVAGAGRMAAGPLSGVAAGQGVNNLAQPGDGR